MKLCVDPRLANLLPGSVPRDWATRALFSHPETFDRWTDRSQDVEAVEGLQELVSIYAGMANEAGKHWRYFVSFGAGGGSVDRAVLTAIKNVPTYYVPIDISQRMCVLSGQHVKDVCAVPFGIVADFEGGFDYLGAKLEPTVGEKRLIGCTGNAFGNLDLGEQNLFQNLFGLMGPDDNLILSVATGAYAQPMNRETFDATIGWNDLVGLLSSGISMITGEPIAAAESSLGQRLDVRQGRSDIPGADTVVLWDRVSGRALLHLRRYDFSEMQQWIQRSFPARIVRSTELRVPSVDFGIGVFMLERQ